ncbi:MAG TPA: pyridoxamine 5'-phosphate oxidase family protein [Puia sp.]|nr:pyridoxamine 5'-phosphate oxidase family protein [Puia sp.]
MLGTLSATQIDNLLLRQAVGRIGYYDGRKTYITPVTYAYDGKDVYMQSNEGFKLDVMRRNPNVCFEVDGMTSLANWESVIAWGKFEELYDEHAVKARTFLYNKVLDLLTAPAVHAHEHEPHHLEDDSNRIKSVICRIRLTEKTGRFERR